MSKRMILALVLAMWLLMPASGVEGAADSEGTHVAAAGQQQGLLPNPADRETQLHALWVIIIFIVMLAILYPTAWKAVLAGLKKREERIRKDIADAEATRTRAEATLRDYQRQLAAAEQKVQEMIAGAVAQGEKAAADIRTRAQQEAEQNRHRTMREIDAARKQALAEIYERAAELSTTIAEKILRRNINADDQRDLVRQSLAQLETVEQ